jgi:hypothetical protein
MSFTMVAVDTVTLSASPRDHHLDVETRFTDARGLRRVGRKIPAEPCLVIGQSGRSAADPATTVVGRVPVIAPEI